MQLSPTALILADRGQRHLFDSARLDTATVEPVAAPRAARPQTQTQTQTPRRRRRLAILRPRPA